MAQSCPASPGDGLRSASPLSTAAGPWHVGRRSAGPCGSGAEHSISAQQAQTSRDRGLLSPPSTQEGTPGGSSIHLRGLRAQLTLARSCSCTVVFPMSRGVMRCMERKS